MSEVGMSCEAVPGWNPLQTCHTPQLKSRGVRCWMDACASSYLACSYFACRAARTVSTWVPWTRMASCSSLPVMPNS